MQDRISYPNSPISRELLSSLSVTSPLANGAVSEGESWFGLIRTNSHGYVQQNCLLETFLLTREVLERIIQHQIQTSLLLVA